MSTSSFLLARGRECEPQPLQAPHPTLHHVTEARSNSIHGPAWLRHPPQAITVAKKMAALIAWQWKHWSKKRGEVLTHKTLNVQLRLYVENTEASKSPCQLAQEWEIVTNFQCYKAKYWITFNVRNSSKPYTNHFLFSHQVAYYAISLFWFFQEEKQVTTD